MFFCMCMATGSVGICSLQINNLPGLARCCQYPSVALLVYADSHAQRRHEAAGHLYYAAKRKCRIFYLFLRCPSTCEVIVLVSSLYIFVFVTLFTVGFKSRSRVGAVAQYAALEANAKINGRGPFSHPHPSETPQPISMSCQIYYYVP